MDTHNQFNKVESDPLKLLEPFVRAVSYSQPPHDKNDIFQARSLIKGYEDHTFYIHEDSVFFYYLKGLPNVLVDEDQSNFPKRDYTWYMNRLMELHRKGCPLASPMRRFLQSFIAGNSVPETQINHILDTINKTERHEEMVEILELSTEFVTLYHEYALRDNKSIRSIIVPLTDAIVDYLRGSIQEDVLVRLSRQSMEIVKDVPHKIDEYSILLLLTVTNIAGVPGIRYSDILRQVDVSLKKMKNQGDPNLYLSGVYDNPVVARSTTLMESLIGDNHSSKMKLKELQLSMGIRDDDVKPFLSIDNLPHGERLSTLDELQGKFHPDAPRRFNVSHRLDSEDVMVVSEGLRGRYTLLEGNDINGDPVYYAQNHDGVMIITKNIDSDKTYKLLRIVDYIDPTIYQGFINPELLDNVRVKVRNVTLRKPDSTRAVMESIVTFSKDGDITFKPRRNLVDEFNQMNRLVKLHIRRGEPKQLKGVMVDLFTLISYVEEKYIGKAEPVLSISRKKRETDMKARMYAVSAFNRSYDFVLDTDKEFDFSKYYLDNKTERVTHKITYGEILGVRKVLGGILSGI